MNLISTIFDIIYVNSKLINFDMKKLYLFLGILLMASVVFAGQPKLKKIEVSPEKVKLGSELVINLSFSKKAGSISSIKLYNVEYPDMAPILELQQNPDAGKNVWSITAPIPMDSPPGVFNWEIKALDKNDKEIVTEDCKDQMQGKTGKLAFEIL